MSNAKERAAKDKPAPNQSRLGNRARKPPSAAHSLPVPLPDPEHPGTERLDPERPGTERLDPERLDSERLDPERPDPVRAADGVADGRPVTELVAGTTAELDLPTKRPSLMAPASPAITDSSGPHPVEVAGLLHELSAALLSADDLPQAMDRLAAFVAAGVPSVMRCSVTLITEGQPLSRVASGTPGQALDDLQYSVGQGPGLDAMRTRELVTAQDLPADGRWPELADCARAQGVHSVAAIPLDVRRSSVGSVSLFVARPNGIVPDLLLTAMAIVNQAEILLGELGRRAAMGEGATVDRAAGVIIAQRGCGVREAYEVLRDTAQRLGMDRRAVAERLIAAAAARTRNPDA